MSYDLNIPIFGFDIGTENCYICEPGQTGIGIRLVDGFYDIPNYLCILKEKRLFGHQAKTKHCKNIDKTYYNLKRLLGKTYDEVQELEKLLYPVEKGSNGELLIRISLLEEEHLVTPTQLLAMVFKKLKYSSDFTPRCIISCPNYFTDTQRRELGNAASIAGLRIVQIFTDLSAVALNYCLYDISDKERLIPHFISFIDIGATSTQCSIVCYCPKEYSGKVLVFDFDKNLGGQNFDETLLNYFINQYDLKLEKKSKLRLLKECEKLKKKMTNTTVDIKIEIKNFFGDKNLKISMNRKTFEDLCKEYFDRIETVLQRAVRKFSILKKRKLIPNVSIKLVQMTGGSSRIPAIRQIVKNVFGMNPTPTLNKANEIVALGCACRTLYFEPTPEIKNIFEFADFQPYQISGFYYQDNGLENPVKNPLNSLIRIGTLLPTSQQFYINCYKLPMIFEFCYVDEQKNITEFSKYRLYSKDKITFLKGRIFVQVRIDRNGLFRFSSGLLEVVKEDGTELPKKASKDFRNSLNFFELDIEIVSMKGHLDKNDIKKLQAFESKFDESVLCEKDDLEFTLYNHVNRWLDNAEEEEFLKYLSLESKNKFIAELTETEKWLIENRNNCESLNKKELFRRVSSLNVYVHKIEKTIIDIHQKKKFCDDLDLVFSLAKKSQKKIKSFELTLDELYCFNEEGFIAEKQAWINEKLDEPKNDEYEDDPKYSYSVCQKKLDILKYFIINNKYG